MALSLRDLHGRLQIACEVLRDAHDTRPQLTVQARAERDGSAVRLDRDLLAVPDSARSPVLLRQFHLGLRPLEVELAHAFDGRTGEERAVADETQAAVVARFCGHLDGSGRAGGCGQGRALADDAEGDAG